MKETGLTTARRMWATETDAVNFVPSQLTAEERKEFVREQAKKSRECVDHLALLQGEILYEIFSGDYYKEWGFKSFAEYVESELDFKSRKASYLVGIYNRLIVELKRDIREIKDIPWSTLKELLPAINEENADRLIEYASDHNMNDVRREVRKLIGSGDEIPEKRRTFVLTEGQSENVERALAIAQQATGSDKKGHLLDVISTEFLVSNLAQNPDALFSTLDEYIDTLRRVFGVHVEVTDIDETVPTMNKEEE
jgi:hypothetical protein